MTTDQIGPIPNLAWDCQKQGCYIPAAPDWSVFNDCFRRGIRFSDIDGAVEANGFQLYVEWKNGRVKLTAGTGQSRMLQRLAQRGDTVLWLLGHGRDVEMARLWTPDSQPEEWAPFTTERAVKAVASWFAATETRKVREWQASAARWRGAA